MSHPRRRPGTLPVLLATALISGVLGGIAPGANAVSSSGAAGSSTVWKPVGGSEYRLDLDALRSRLAGAPATVALPSPSGETIDFVVERSVVMEPGLAARYPGIRTWAGRSTGDAAASIRLDVTPAGFHASVRGGGASWYVEPTGDGNYRSMRGDALAASTDQQVEHLVEQLGSRTAARAAARAGAPTAGEGSGADVVERTFRLALLTDDTYADYVTVGASDPTDPIERDELVTAAKVTLVNRLNQVYGDDLSVRLVLVDETDRTSLDTPAEMYTANGPCGPVACFTATMVENGCTTQLLDRNRLVLGQVVGADDYDLGFLGLGTDSGTAAGVGVAGLTSKAAGCAGLTTPVGDFFALDQVAHELGHQLGAHHTFDGSVCAGEGNPASAVEPGSGSSIMSRAGKCGSDDLQPHVDPYFSQRSQSEVATFLGTARPAVREVQNVGLTGFGPGGSFSVAYPGGTPVTVTDGTYTAAGLKSALETAEPSSATVTVGGFWGFGLSNGFQATWSGTGVVASPTITPTAGSFTASVGITDDGGAARNGGAPVATGNHNPVVTAPADRVIPARTPFELPGSATDPDGDQLTYLWEQNDAGTASGAALTSNTRSGGPLFRIFGTYADVSEAGSLEYGSPGQNATSSSPVRSFPDVAQVAAGHTNALTGACPASGGSAALPRGPVLDCYSEFLPTAARTLDFRLTARDLGGSDGGTDGGVAHDDTTLTVSELGPFLVTSHNSASSVAAGATGTVTWSPDLGSLAANVRITLSTDGGLTYPTVLNATTPNDGSQTVQWPAVSTTRGRIKVEAVDNYFYDLSNADLTITGGGSTGSAIELTGNADGGLFAAASSDPLTTTPSLTVSASTVNGSALTLTATGLPQGLSLTRQTYSTSGVRPATARFVVGGVADVVPGTYPVTLTADDGPGLAPARTTSFTVAVQQDTATLEYTGDVSLTTGGSSDAVQVRVSATAGDADATSGVVIGSIGFSDQATGKTLCSAPLTGQQASCTFGADLDGAVERTYEVVATLVSPRYSGATAPTAVVVTKDSFVVVDSLPQVVTAQYSDAVAETFTVTASDADGRRLTVSGNLPYGVNLARTGVSDDGVRPGVATFLLSGGADLDQGEHVFDVTATDGGVAARTVTSTVVIDVVPEDAAVAYTGPGTIAAPAGNATQDFELRARVTSDPDGTPGVVTGASVEFVDTMTGATLCAGARVLPEPGGEVGYATCPVTAALTGTGRAYRVRLQVGGAFTGSAEPAPVTVTQPDVTAPDTTITSGPAQDSFATAATVTVGWSSEPGATYACSLVGYIGPVACPSSSTTSWTNLPAGSYEFRVAARDAAGNLDATPATRRFHVPVDDRLLKKGTGTWKKKTTTTAFRGGYQTVAKKGSSLTYKVTGARSLALIFEAGPRYGTFDVYLGTKKLKTVKTAASKVTPMVVTVLASSTSGLTGTLKIVSTSNAPVRLDGLGVLKALPAARLSLL